MRGEESATFLAIKYKKMWQFLPLSREGVSKNVCQSKRVGPYFRDN